MSSLLNIFIFVKLVVKVGRNKALVSPRLVLYILWSRGHNQINYFVISDYFTSLNSYLQSKSVRAATIIYNLWPLNISEFLGSLKNILMECFSFGQLLGM